MSEFTVNIFQKRGSSYQIGLTLGKQISSTSIPERFEKITRPKIDTENMKAIYQSFAPHLLDEMKGLTEGAQISEERTAALFSGYDIPKVEALGCSAMLTNTYYVRNYDFSPVLYDGFFSLIQPEKAFATAGYNLQVIGRHDGVNQEGLVAGLHFVSNHGYTKGVSAWTAVRMVLDTCATVTGAINLLKEIPHAACYNFSLGDKTGKAVVVEASPENVKIRHHETFLTCTNHFQDKSHHFKNKSFITNSLDRSTRIQTQKESHLSHEEAFDYFRDINSPLFCTDYDDLFGTLHTFSYHYADSRIMTAIAQSEQVLDVNFNEWVAGTNLWEQRLKGIIEQRTVDGE